MAYRRRRGRAGVQNQGHAANSVNQPNRNSGHEEAETNTAHRSGSNRGHGRGRARGQTRITDASNGRDRRPAPLVPNAFHVPAPKLSDIIIPITSIEAQGDDQGAEVYTYHSLQDWLAEFPFSVGDDIGDSQEPQISTAPTRAESTGDVPTMRRIMDPLPHIETREDASVEPNGAPSAVAEVKGFFGLPWEIRFTVYWDVIRPDCKLDFPDHCGLHHTCIKNGNGTTNILLVNSQTYQEGSEILHMHENFILLKGKSPSLFRHMREFGRPGKFQSFKPGYAAIIPPRYGELQFLQFRKVAICIQLSPLRQRERFQTRLDFLKKQITQLSGAVSKSQRLTFLRIMISDSLFSGSCNPYVGAFFADVAEADRVSGAVRNMLRPLIELAVSKGIKVGAEEETLSRGFDQHISAHIMDVRSKVGDPFVAWINAIVPAGQRAKFDFDYRMNVNEKRVDSITSNWETVPFEVHRREKYPDHCIEREKERFNKTFAIKGVSSDPYQLKPECRTCYALFGSWEDLKKHLENQPKHRTSYRAKEWNTIHPDAEWGGWVKCHTCGYTPPKGRVTGLETHYRNQPAHRRHGIIPRWNEDNRRWNRDQPKHSEVDTHYPYTERQLRLRERFERGRR